MKATFITLAAYDYRLLPASIAQYYDAADEIIVGLDRNNISWSGTPFDCDHEELDRVLGSIDPQNKITVEVGDFHSYADPMTNDSTERERLASLARNEWVVEVDADELVDGAAVLAALEQVPEGAQLYVFWRTVFKVIDDTALVVTPQTHTCPLATKSRRRERARVTGEPPFLVPGLEVLHLSTARTEAELTQKLTSWSHSTQVRPDFLDQWRAVDLSNYQAARDLHPFIPTRWPGLEAVPLKDLR